MFFGGRLAEIEKCLASTDILLANRLAFAQRYVDRDMRFWRNALFADESRIEVRPSDKRILVRRPDGQRYSKDLSQLGRMVVNQQCFGGVFRGLDNEY